MVVKAVHLLAYLLLFPLDSPLAVQDRAKRQMRYAQRLLVQALAELLPLRLILAHRYALRETEAPSRAPTAPNELGEEGAEQMEARHDHYNRACLLPEMGAYSWKQSR